MRQARIHSVFLPASHLTNHLHQVKERKYKHPHQVYEVPIEADFLNHFVVATLLKRTISGSDEAPYQQADAREHVRTVEARDEEE